MENFDDIPDYPVEMIVNDIHLRDAERRKAVDVAFRVLMAADTREEKMSALAELGRMQLISNEFREQFPEVFPAEDE